MVKGAYYALERQGSAPRRAFFEYGDPQVAKLLETYNALTRQLDKSDLSVIAALVASSDYTFKLAQEDGFELHLRDERAPTPKAVVLTIKGSRITSHQALIGPEAATAPKFEALRAQGAEVIWKTEPQVIFDETDIEPPEPKPEPPLVTDLTKMSRVYFASEDRLAESDHEAINDLIVCSVLAFAAKIDQADASSMIVMFAGDPGQVEQIRIFLLEDEVTGFDWTREGGEYPLEDMVELKDTSSCIWLKGQRSAINELNDRVEPTDPALH